jgi:hypothetical protein
MEARIKLEFYGTDKSETNEHSLVAYSNIANEIYLSIDMGDIVPSFICLDKPTAVRLVRELKKQIGNLESEVSNG